MQPASPAQVGEHEAGQTPPTNRREGGDGEQISVPGAIAKPEPGVSQNRSVTTGGIVVRVDPLP